MIVTVWYWVNHYDTITGWKNGEVITITSNEIFELSKKFDVAIFSTKTEPRITYLAIDELGKRFRQR
jgi:hypothetical protein